MFCAGFFSRPQLLSSCAFSATDRKIYVDDKLLFYTSKAFGGFFGGGPGGPGGGVPGPGSFNGGGAPGPGPFNGGGVPGPGSFNGGGPAPPIVSTGAGFASRGGRKLCVFFNSARGCKSGDRCQFLHDPSYLAPQGVFQNITRDGGPRGRP